MAPLDHPSPDAGSATVIVLNGSSSSGKTTLAAALQQRLTLPFQHVSLDQFRDGMPGRYRGLNSAPGTPGFDGLNIVPIVRDGQPMTDIRFGPYGESMLRGMRRAVAAFAANGLNVIVDDLLFKTDYLDDYVQVLSPFNAYLIGLRADVDTIRTREADRTGRFPGTAEAHYDVVHAHGCPYDLEIDTSQTTPTECATAIIARLSRPPESFKRRAQFLEASPKTTE